MYIVCNYVCTYIIHKHYIVLYCTYIAYACSPPSVFYAVMNAKDFNGICSMHSCAVFTYSEQLPKEMCKQLA